MSEGRPLMAEQMVSPQFGDPEIQGGRQKQSKRKCATSFHRTGVSWRCWLTHRSRLIVKTALTSIILVLVVQCLFWNVSPWLSGCCSHDVVRVGGIDQQSLATDARMLQGNNREQEVARRKSEADSRWSRRQRRKRLKALGEDFTQGDGVSDGKGDLEQRLPQCIIIGVRKGGTRALLEFLSIHPSIRAHRAEIHFFDDEHNYGMGLEWYRTSMPHSHPNQITLEKTPAYFVTEEVPERVYAMNRSIKLLIVMRDPIERAISDYDQIREQKERHGKDQVPFEQLAIQQDTGHVNEGYNAIRRSVYHRFMARWLRLFPLAQIHLVSGEELVKDPVSELRKVEEFLDIPPRLSDNQFYLNKTRGFYCMRNIGVGNVERCLARSKGRPHTSIDPEVVDKLRRYFRPHNERFYRMVGIDFGWRS